VKNLLLHGGEDPFRKLGLCTVATVRKIYFLHLCRCQYGVAFVSRIDKIMGSFAKEPYKRDDILQKRPII